MSARNASCIPRGMARNTAASRLLLAMSFSRARSTSDEPGSNTSGGISVTAGQSNTRLIRPSMSWKNGMAQPPAGRGTIRRADSTHAPERTPLMNRRPR